MWTYNFVVKSANQKQRKLVKHTTEDVEAAAAELDSWAFGA